MVEHPFARRGSSARARLGRARTELIDEAIRPATAANPAPHLPVRPPVPIDRKVREVAARGRRRERFKIDLSGLPLWRRACLYPFLIPLRLYQVTISPFMPPICRFTPTCSDYALEAIQERGVFVGFLLGIWRVLRCNPFSRGGFDPVPRRPSAPKGVDP